MSGIKLDKKLSQISKVDTEEKAVSENTLGCRMYIV